MKNFLGGMVEGKSKKKLIAFSFVFVAIFLFLPFNHADAWDLGLGDMFKGLASEGFSILVSLVSAILRKLIWPFAAFLVSFGAWLVDVFLDPALYERVLTMDSSGTGGQAVEAGWRTVRDFCNMFYIFFLLLIAFSTIVRSQAYSVKNVLPKVILSIFLINFSKVIAEIIIDCGQVFLFGFAGWMGSFSGPTGKGAGLTVVVDLLRSQFEGTDNSSIGTLVILISSIAYTVMLGLMYILLAGFLLFRLISFVFLIIVSPFAFFGLSLPSMKRYWNQWISTLISNTLSGPVLIFFIYISAIMAVDIVTYQPTVETNNLGYIQYTIQYIVKGLIPLGMMYFAIPMSQKMGGFGARQLIGGTAGLGTVAMSSYAVFKAGRNVAGGTASRVHAGVKGSQRTILGHNVGQTYSNATKALSSAMEKAPLVGNAYIKHEVDNQGKIRMEVDGHKKVLKTLMPEQMGAYVDNMLDPKRKAEARLAMMETLAEKGKLGNDDLVKAGYKDSLGNFDKVRMMKDLQTVRNYGGDVSEVYKQRLDFLSDPKEIEKEIGKAVGSKALGNIKLDVLADDRVKDRMKAVLPKEQYDNWMKGKSQVEKDAYLSRSENSLVAGIKKGLPMDSDKVKDFQKEHFLLARPTEKVDKMGEVRGVAGNRMVFTPDPQDKMIKEGLPKLSKGDKLNFKKADYQKIGHHFTLEDYKSVSRLGTEEQKEEIMKANIAKQAQYDSIRKSATATAAEKAAADADYHKITDKIDKMTKIT